MTEDDDSTWDPNKYQGRSRKQVEANNAEATWVVLIGLGMLAGWGIYVILRGTGVI